MLEETVAALNIGARLEISRVNRSGIWATKVDVSSQMAKRTCRERSIGSNGRRSPSIRTRHHGHDHDTHMRMNSEPVALLEHNYALQITLG